MLKNQINTRKQGDVGTGMAIAYFTTKGWTVSIPLADNQDYDLIVDIEGELKRVQIKTTYRINKYGIYEANLRVNGGNKSGNSTKIFDNTKIDYLFVLTEEQTMYFIPSDELEAKSSVSLGKKYEKFKVKFE